MIIFSIYNTGDHLSFNISKHILPISFILGCLIFDVNNILGGYIGYYISMNT